MEVGVGCFIEDTCPYSPEETGENLETILARKEVALDSNTKPSENKSGALPIHQRDQ
jgi:hypothetical protein